MILWRLVPEPFADTALDGRGAAVNGGRWNSPGRRAGYLSVEPSTTVLEALTTFAYTNLPRWRYVLLRVEYTGSVETLDASTLPRGWDRQDDATLARPAGDAFLSEGRAGVLLVPSVVLPVALNAVLNPLHVDAAQARIVEKRGFTFDPRWPVSP